MGPLTLIGSAETSPGMVRVHREILSGLPSDPRVVYVDTPHGFQENAALITEKVQEYFDRSLSQAVEVASLTDAARASEATIEAFRIAVEGADYVFAGPGSPSYALRQWHAVQAADSLTRASASGSAITLASAAAVTAGRWAIPVYEIYKVGAEPFWLDGLGLLSRLTGVAAIVVPHWDNQDGEHHDTRHCYIGRRRLDQLIDQLAEPIPIIGIDEHTAATFFDGQISIVGRGGLTVLNGPDEQIIQSGDTVTIASLFAVRPSARSPIDPATEPKLREMVATDALAAADLVLSSLTDDADDETRRLIVELALAVPDSQPDLQQQIAPFVDQLIEARSRARDRQDFDEADRIRLALTESGVEVHDEPEHSSWTLRGQASLDS